MIHRDELPFLTQNKTLTDIQFMYEDLDDKRIIFRESCKNYLLEKLKEYDEENPLKCKFELDCGVMCAIPELQTATIQSMCVEEGDVFLVSNGCGPYDLDVLNDYELEQLIELISK